MYMTLKNGRKLGKLAKFFLVVREQRKIRENDFKRSSEIQKFFQANVNFCWWSANRDKICEMVRESEKIENRWCNRYRSCMINISIGLCLILEQHNAF